jgi:lipopolysaccharide transport system ATP-binding protein
MRRGLRVGVVGTFDVENFGDLLFPLLTQRELTSRLDEPEIRLYSYWERSAEAWPYPVRSLARLPDDVTDLDLLIVGAGHLVRFDKKVATGYEPPPGLHHPTGYWLMPTLLGEAYGVPVAWNSLTVSPGTPEWARGLLGLAARSARYVTVRDEPSRQELARVADSASVTLVPDIAFGVKKLLPNMPSDAFHRFLAENALRGPYIAVQPSPHLVRHAWQIDAAVAEARAQGCAVLELPISPALGDRTGLLRLEHATVRPATWPPPLLLAEIIARAEAVIARSLHLSVVALACGVPVHRHRSASEPKYEPLQESACVHFWDDGVDVTETMRKGIGATAPDADVARRLRELETHWDTLAGIDGHDSHGANVLTELILLATAGLESLGTRETLQTPIPARRRVTNAFSRRLRR